MGAVIMGPVMRVAPMRAPLLIARPFHQPRPSQELVIRNADDSLVVRQPTLVRAIRWRLLGFNRTGSLLDELLLTACDGLPCRLCRLRDVPFQIREGHAGGDATAEIGPKILPIHPPDVGHLVVGDGDEGTAVRREGSMTKRRAVPAQD